MSKFNSTQALKSFLESNSSFEVLYNSHSNFNFNSVTRLCVLDSSFNPPHKGHESLARKSVYYDYSKRQEIKDTSIESVSLLLLLSVKNADKIVPKPASFDHRINMMRLMADNLSNNLNVNVSIGLTDRAKFVDKSRLIISYLNSEGQFNEHLKLTFLLGYDTLIRVFDPKYYHPNTVENSLTEFMDLSDIFVLTRASDSDLSLESQLSYVEKIKKGYFKEIPLHWGSKIFLVKGGDDSLNISSSGIRSNVLNRQITAWKQDVNVEVSSYIEEHRLYEL